MFGLKRITIKKNERGLLLRNGDFERVLQPGQHWVRTLQVPDYHVGLLNVDGKLHDLLGAERIDKISVFGGLDQVLNGLVKLR